MNKTLMDNAISGKMRGIYVTYVANVDKGQWRTKTGPSICHTLHMKAQTEGEWIGTGLRKASRVSDGVEETANS